MLSISNVTFHYKNQPLFDNISLELAAGEFAFLIGKSGSGKTTLLQLIYMNVLPESGTITVGQFNSSLIKKSQLALLRRKIGIVFQDFKLLADRNVYENLAFVLEVTNTPKRDIKRKVNDALTEVGLSHKRLNMPNQLSGGEKQRIAIARAILNDPLIILADEPTGNLDPETSSEILDLLMKINKRGTAILFATHNYELVRKNSNARIFKIENGKITKGFLKQSV
ncbi:Cell division transport system ATP-binding protein [Ignavibacterium album JCM 16511]|uniref:Cell division ATP-binding protein FtsE n=1 Tax=Ignavibacterium album (strain DSM 19864 / JCM 16511 / NBRC 101810 / Mat9-16) TaxID=945713 RepID=I0AK12_IGNAJ|nr:cell division ATP-binding protein FtsE [Ignavibacterium album]AFH49319.1 Cell division transport system ATP-binding protein [Ignavibacterium album JCM 16511]